MAEGFNVRGVKVTWLMRGPYWLRTFSTPTAGTWWTRSRPKHGVTMVHCDEIKEVVTDNGVPERVIGTSGRKYDRPT